jgi:hypothetical protein
VTTFEVSLVTAVVAAMLGAVGTYFTARRDLQLKFDASLRDLRIEAYQELWADLQDLAKYGRSDALTKDQARSLSERLRTWYFKTGGLFLSSSTRRDYFAMQDGLELIISASDHDRVSDENDEYLRALSSRLRTALTRDVGTRRTFIFRGGPDRHAPPLKPCTYGERGGPRRLEIGEPRAAGLIRRLPFLPWSAASARPSLTLPGGQLVAWDRERQTMTVRVTTDTADAEERLILVEKGYLVDGPKGWRRDGDASRRGPSVIWNANDGQRAARDTQTAEQE